MKRDRFLARLREDARETGAEIDVDFNRGKGGHCIVRLGVRFSVVKSGELTPSYMNLVRKQLGLRRK